jgi:hypothetical protein
MPDAPIDRLAPLLELAEALNDADAGLRARLLAVLDLVERDTAAVIEQTLIATDIAARTKAGDWFQNTELAQISNDAGHILREYKAQRTRLGEIRAVLDDEGGSAD